RQREPDAIDLFLEDDRVIDVEATATVCLRRARIEPAAGAELAAERTQLVITPPAVVVGDRNPRQPGRDVGVQPGADLMAEALLLLGVRDLEVHSAGPREGSESANYAS